MGRGGRGGEIEQESRQQQEKRKKAGLTTEDK
jgi:hypothetical protein